MFKLEGKYYLSLMNIMYANVSNNTPSYIHICSYVIWRVHPLAPPYLFVHVCMIVWVVFLSNDVIIGYILLFKWVDSIFLGVKIH